MKTKDLPNILVIILVSLLLLSFAISFLYLEFYVSSDFIQPPNIALGQVAIDFPDKSTSLARSAGMKSDAEINFWRAIYNRSTSPGFVLITVTDANTNTTSQYATLSNYLLGAIHLEYALPYDESGTATADKLALSAKSRHFIFSNTDALNNIENFYDDSILNVIRDTFSKYSNQELLIGFNSIGGDFHSLYMKQKGIEVRSYKFAIAHVLLERGLYPGIGCVSSQLWVVE